MTSPKSIWTDDSLETPFAAALKFRVKKLDKNKKQYTPPLVSVTPHWMFILVSQTEIIATFYSWILLLSCTSASLGSIMLQFLLRNSKTEIKNVQLVLQLFTAKQVG